MPDKNQISKQIDKQIVKEAIEEWLDKQFAKFGKWSLAAIASVGLAWIFYGWLNMQGFHK